MKFKEYSFRDLLINIVDNRGRTCPTVEQGIPLIATNCIKNTGLYPVYEKLRYVSEETYNSWFRDHPKPGDMVFVCKGSPGRVCWVSDPVPFCIAQDMVAIRADETIVYPKYLFALLRSEVVQNQILNMHVGTLIPHFKKGDFANLYLQVPEDMEYQKQVGDVYFSFCEKIENNHQINQTLEQMAQAIFKSWFVDFEPVKAKIAVLEAGGSAENALLAAMQAISGKNEVLLNQLQTEQPEQYAELRATAELFPSAMQESELGEIPEGWGVAEVSEFGDVVCGKTPSKSNADFYGGKIPFLKIPDMHGNMFVTRVGEYLSEQGDKSQKKKAIPANSVCVSCIATVGLVSITTQESHTNQQINSIVPSKSSYMPYLYFRMKSLHKLLHDLASGGSATLNLNTGVFSRIRVLHPTDTVLSKFYDLVLPLLEQMKSNAFENQILADARDTLLPKLLSGELQLPEAEAQIQEAADAV